MDNKSSGSHFMLLEFSAIWELQILHFFFFMVLYLTILTGNLLIISAIIFYQHLHTPMYFFVINVAMQDIFAISVIIPKSMANSLLNTGEISYSGCVAQVFLSLFFLASNFSFLTIMAYDRHVAICNPLQYTMVMNRQACIKIAAGGWFAGLLCSVLNTGGTFATPFCSNIVNQFFCDIPHLLKLSCSNLYLVETGILVVTIVIEIGCFVFIIVTYVMIFSTVLRIPSVQGRQKALSTCLPQLIVFCTYVSSGWLAYLKPPSNTPSALDLALTMLYTFVPPMLNPVIYSMRNKDIKVALAKLLVLVCPPNKMYSTFCI